MKLHPSIVISQHDKTSVYVNGECKLFRVTDDEAEEYASSISDTLWTIEWESKPPIKRRAIPDDYLDWT